MKFDILKFRYIFIYFSLIMTLASIFVLSFYKLKIGIDFTGGSVLELRSKIESNESIKEVFQKRDLPITISKTTQDSVFIIKTKTIDEKTKDEIINELSKVGESEQLSFESVGPTISESLKNKAILSVIFASLAIILYIAYAFRNLPNSVSAWRFGIIAVVALLHDIFITTGAFAFSGIFLNYEVDSLFITAILTVMGFSVHDTIVVFDRIRENVILNPRNSFYINTSHALAQTFSRSLSTSLTLIFALSALFVLGGSTLQHFIFTLLFGIIIGTYSSIFIASNLIVIWHNKRPLN
ncbi:protein translocase subunit SecF [Candidatus Berkelbacteria bacterium CG_4_8_14_3_um_filter_33_6]|uniref:Protein-export membrane protein SecF n=1 Tax=Candidatus Berkelbacteria bacterium CG_4_10_14_0_2_um_filter_35_9_33_12 TaxID=1974499 RepID=A0A2M7W4S6_9BACT|nr:MAG: protein translocase subunit SecF [Candidatus Berkelbacteria bacterium CG23_combo_of_CG06-09_8_20_14_all_33_15]PIX31055.1 MAG: protein translocase subunit SecF [Candidatus Berkelbacteria bacterium CG_4_8_14_3_um_filter_33_6]PIZ28529.1 MAG: protein translocase subunit SecF [Candidatus Berkelbacteria bacterium CG_4_10_14_0_8_um_filter_35_9_33_8]PJA20887.1 MAG: protein translocase subunit SecF [Candidatus Berkelbacteria bacterium CG_4_10_14_0_2_um_filter_35_9_33_12]PJB52206.1 MAG: protein t